jgi:hypothetical protein
MVQRFSSGCPRCKAKDTAVRDPRVGLKAGFHDKPVKRLANMK